MLPSDPLFPAAAGTVLLRFRFFSSAKAHKNLVLENTIHRPIICWRIAAGDRPVPVTVARPLDDTDDDFVGAEAVIIPGSGVYDVYNGTAWPNSEKWIETVVGNWSLWLKQSAPPPAAVERTTVVTRGGLTGFAPN